MPRTSSGFNNGAIPYASIAMCIALAVFCLLAPVQQFRTTFTQRCLSSWDQLYDPSEDFFQNNDDNVIFRFLKPFIKFFFKLFATCGKEIVFIVLVIHFYPTLKGTYNRDVRVFITYFAFQTTSNLKVLHSSA